MFRTALRTVLAHKARLLMTVLAVMLGVAFVSGTLVFTNTVSEAFQKSSAKGYDQVDVAIQPKTRKSTGDTLGKKPELTQPLLDKAAKVQGADSAIGVVGGFTAIADKDGKLIGGGFRTQGGNYWGAKDIRYPLVSGHAPQGAGQVLIDSKTAERAGYKVGDTVRISIDGPVLKPEITGIFTTDDGNVAAGGSLALFDTATAQRLFDKTGVYDEIDVKAAPGTSQVALRHALDEILPKDIASTITGEQLADDQAKQIAESTSGLRTALLVFAGIALFVGTFIIANTFTMLVAQRTKELALLRAVGASRRQVTRSVLIEAAVVGAVAAVAGLLAGIGIGAGMRSLMSSFGGAALDGPLVISPSTVLIAFAVGIVITMLAAYLPARRAAKIPPVAAMSSVHAKATTKSLVVRNTIGSLFAGVGVAVVLYAITLKGSDGQMPMGLGAVLLVIGVFVLTPLLSRPLIAAASPLLRVFGIAGKLARQNSLRNPRRTAATASALMIGLTLITGLTVITSGLQRGIDHMAASSIKADYVVAMANSNPLSPDVAEKLRKTDGVTKTSPLRFEASRINGKTEYVMGVDGTTFGSLSDLTAESGSLTLRGPHLVVDAKTAKSRKWHAGSRVTASFTPGHKQQLTVAGIYHSSALKGIILDNATLSAYESHPADYQVMLKTDGGPSAATKDALEKALGDNPAIKVQDKKDISDYISQSLTLALNILYGLLAMAVIVAVLGVINTLAMSVFERSQEIGMLRAIGLDRRGIKRMVRLESLVISLFGGVLGIGLGVFFGWAGGRLIGARMSTYELVLPWGRMAVFLLLAALVGVLAALWPARRAARLNMLTAINSQ
ncbi:FtsX-like permease family protein [Streptomyces sp. NPDC052051]|uniref:ABC transporter permease n=1 Tax=Streptomyces sp. NPDC052051 TaxID=3154649 RepID=UPI0034227E5D